MYLDYWNLNRNPFDNVPDPNMYFCEHSTVEGTVSELLFAIEEANECLAVVVGEVGLGKTMSLRVVLNELAPDQYKIAYVTNPDVTFNQLLRDIVGQLRGEKSEIRNREDLLEEFNSILFESSDAGKKVLIFIDEGNALRPENLEGLRLLTNMQEDDKNLFTLVLAGQPKLAKMLRDPRRANIYQRIGVFCTLEPLESVEIVESYVNHRLAVAGSTSLVFDRTGFEAVYERSGGIPRLINRVCKLAMKAAETNRHEIVTGELVHLVADRFAQLEGRKEKTPVFPAPETFQPAERKKKSVEKFQSSRGDVKEASEPETAAVETGERKREGTEPERSVGNGEITKEALRATAGSPEPAKHGKIKIQLMGVSKKSIFQLREMANPRDKLRFAGVLAAQELKINPERFEGIDSDPVRIWDDLRRAIIEAV